LGRVPCEGRDGLVAEVPGAGRVLIAGVLPTCGRLPVLFGRVVAPPRPPNEGRFVPMFALAIGKFGRFPSEGKFECAGRFEGVVTARLFPLFAVFGRDAGRAAAEALPHEGRLDGIRLPEGSEGTLPLLPCGRFRLPFPPAGLAPLPPTLPRDGREPPLIPPPFPPRESPRPPPRWASITEVARQSVIITNAASSTIFIIRFLFVM
jgi:hypothetical protein